jgi:hypothetical protein
MLEQFAGVPEIAGVARCLVMRSGCREIAGSEIALGQGECVVGKCQARREIE